MIGADPDPILDLLLERAGDQALIPPILQLSDDETVIGIDGGTMMARTLSSTSLASRTLMSPWQRIARHTSGGPGDHRSARGAGH